MYSQEIEAIHHAFATAGDELLEQANQIIAGTDEQSVSKVNRLKALGFTASRQVTQTAAQLQKHADAKVTAAIVQDYATRYPNQKFITKEQVEQICSKYKLVCGPISNYTGFVPEKNLQEIEQFNPSSKDVNYFVQVGHITFSSVADSGDKRKVRNLLKQCNSMIACDAPVTRVHGYEYQESIDSIVRSYCRSKNIQPYIDSVDAQRVREPMQICAPATDFNTSNLGIWGKFMRELNSTTYSTAPPVPDPVVLQPVKHGFLVCSCWGPESEDPILN